MTRIGLLCMSLMFGALFAGCSGECSSAFDCDSTEVCFKEVCTPASASYLQCSTNSDCADDPNFACQGGYCRLIGSGSGVAMDASTPDTGPGPDTGIVDTGVTQDTGIADTGTSTTPDSGIVDAN